VQDIEQAAARIADGADDTFEPAAPVVFDNDARIWSEIDPQIGVDPFGVCDGSSYSVVDETPSQWAAFDEKLNIENARQNPVKGPDDQLVLTDG
jgi:hypothetical protein